MPYLLGDDGPGIEEGLIAFGHALREARYRGRLSQTSLESRSGVDQTLISRLERGKARHCSLHRILAVQRVLGTNLPLGFCPHDHDCIYRGKALPPHLARRFDFREYMRNRRVELGDEPTDENPSSLEGSARSVRDERGEGSTRSR